MTATRGLARRGADAVLGRVDGSASPPVPLLRAIRAGRPANFDATNEAGR
jgi:hypothetical protein